MHPAPALAIVLAAALGACAAPPEGRAPRPSDDGADRGSPPVAAEPSAPPAPSLPVPPQTPVAPGEDARTYETVTIRVAGMTCPIRCVREVKEALQAAPGVLDVFIDYDRREARVNVRPGTDPESLLEALKPKYTGRLR